MEQQVLDLFYLSLLLFTASFLYWQPFRSVQDGSRRIQEQQQQQALLPVQQQGPKQPTTSHKSNKDKNPIRRWGCGLRDTPLVFVHINKAGGGSVRRRLAVTAINYTRPINAWREQRKDQSYYPIRSNPSRRSRRGIINNDTGSERDSDSENDMLLIGKATFCNSGHAQYMPILQRSFEGTRICNATTPIGQALACPATFPRPSSNALRRQLEQKSYHGGNVCGGDTLRDINSSHVVYVGHNGLGTELHWLPVPYLQQWWQQHWATSRPRRPRRRNNKVSTTTLGFNKDATREEDDVISNWWQRLDGIQPWCGSLPRPLFDSNNISAEAMTLCSQRIQNEVDAAAHTTLEQYHHWSMDTPTNRGRAWSAVYASLPIIRVILMRNPFTWFTSKYAWHHLSRKGIVCDNISQATAGAGHSNMYEGMREERIGSSSMKVFDINGSPAPGWIRRLSLEYIYQLCGSDCRVRHLQQQATLQEITVQAEFNLRNAFAVVGILEDGEEIFLI